MSTPLVSVVCLCHNQASFVQEALNSVWAQSYSNVELVVVDDGSVDGSAGLIEELLKNRTEVQFFKIPQAIGNCKAFNCGLKLSKGKYVIDLAADDLLLTERIAEGVKALEVAGEDFAVHFTDALYINPQGKTIRSHYKHNREGRLIEKVPQGWVYADVLQRYFICTPTMMMRRSVLDELGGYDETLAYEDFDFWVRSAREWQYCFTDKVLVKKRVVPHSWSSKQYQISSGQLATTIRVCKKAKRLNRNKVEDEALAKRLGYEIRQAIRTKNYTMASQMLIFKRQSVSRFGEDLVYLCLIRWGLLTNKISELNLK